MTQGWESIDGFRSEIEFRRAEEWLVAQLSLGEAEEVPVKASYGDVGVLGERWFRRSSDRLIWRLVPPDPPFAGVFEPVDPSAPHGR
jgi:hypothetical protein